MPRYLVKHPVSGEVFLSIDLESGNGFQGFVDGEQVALMGGRDHASGYISTVDGKHHRLHVECEKEPEPTSQPPPPPPKLSEPIADLPLDGGTATWGDYDDAESYIDRVRQDLSQHLTRFAEREKRLIRIIEFLGGMPIDDLEGVANDWHTDRS